MPRYFSIAILSLGLCLCGSPSEVTAEEAPIEVLRDIAYKAGPNLTEYEQTRCKLDIYRPRAGRALLPTLVWFHGGGLTGGDKAGKETAATAASLAQEGLIIVSVNYRLSPKAKFPAYLEDAAAAVAWVRRNITQHGGDPGKVFVSGHSAGGYLATMLAMDTKYLAAQQLKPADFAGYAPVSGQMVTHFTIREERGIPRSALVIDSEAPLYHVRKSLPPMLVLYAEHDMALRAEENRFFCEALRAAGCSSLTSVQIMDHDHGSIGHKLAVPRDQGRLELLSFIQKIAASQP